MTSIHLVVTGRCEEVALDDSLRRYFPNATFARPLRLDSFTSTPLAEPPSPRTVTLLDKFAMKLVELVDERSDDLVIGVDDLELDNDARLTTSAMRDAVQRVVERCIASAQHRDRIFERLRRSCSFHLLVPMVEAYFFADPSTLAAAGAVAPSLFDASRCDVEAFEVDDAAYLAPPPTTPETEPNAERRKRSWAKPIDVRRRHPKLYLKYLTSPGDHFGSPYREAQQGANALRALSWPSTLAREGHCVSARALFNDVADFLAIERFSNGLESTETSRATNRASRVLRNI